MSLPHSSSAGRDAALLGRIEPGRGSADPTWSGADLTNVIPFLKRQREAGEAGAYIRFVPGERLAPTFLTHDRRAWMLTLLVGSFAAHTGLYWMLNREPPPLASVGIESMSVEIVLGTDMPAGRAEEPAKSEEEPAPPSTQAAQEPAQPEPHREAVQQGEPEPSLPAEAAPAASNVEPPPAPSVSAPSVLAVPSAKDAVPPPRLAPPKRVDTAPARQPKQPRPVRQHQAMLPTAAGAPATSANGVGRGRSDADSNYRGLVAAHLARHKRFPADARSRGDQGVVSVSFSLDGGGRVTSIALMRGSGVASLDQEVQAMVHPASPFPSPPSGRSMSFTVPVSFRLQ